MLLVWVSKPFFKIVRLVKRHTQSSLLEVTIYVIGDFYNVFKSKVIEETLFGNYGYIFLEIFPVDDWFGKLEFSPVSSS